MALLDVWEFSRSYHNFLQYAELRLILIGKSGGGKSATGNNMLGQKEFESLLEAKTTTLQCQKGEGTWQRRKIMVVDTPSMFDSEGYDEIVRQEIMACVELSQPGPHALILVTQVGRFTTEDATAAKCVWDIFGPESAKHTIVMFTCMEDLSGSPLQEYVQKLDNRNLWEVMRRCVCGYRICGFNNKAEGDERERQVVELMTMVRSTVVANGGRYYTNRLYRMPNVREEHVKSLEPHRNRDSGLVNLCVGGHCDPYCSLGPLFVRGLPLHASVTVGVRAYDQMLTVTDAEG
uniref:AIG1-type G domain-containing protein n=1 Tax=Naja naja TaxID=35670 RepID=A0A8C6XMR9_NAJNA